MKAKKTNLQKSALFFNRIFTEAKNTFIHVAILAAMIFGTYVLSVELGEIGFYFCLSFCSMYLLYNSIMAAYNIVKVIAFVIAFIGVILTTSMGIYHFVCNVLN